MALQRTIAATSPLASTIARVRGRIGGRWPLAHLPTATRGRPTLTPARQPRRFSTLPPPPPPASSGQLSARVQPEHVPPMPGASGTRVGGSGGRGSSGRTGPLRFAVTVTLAWLMWQANENIHGPHFPTLNKMLRGMMDSLEETVQAAENKARGKKPAKKPKAKKRELPPLKAKQFRTAGGDVMWYYDDGKGAPAVVINATTKSIGAELHREISKFTRCITYDHSGLGDVITVPKEPRKRDVPDMSAELAEVLRGTKIASDVVLVGTHHNWMSTLTTARRNADHVSGVVLVEPLVPDRHGSEQMTDDQFMEGCLSTTTWWAKMFLVPGNWAVAAMTVLMGNNAHMLNPATRQYEDLSAVDALIERVFVDAVYFPDPERHFTLSMCTPSPTRYATAASVRIFGNPRWKVLANEWAGVNTAFRAEVAAGRLVPTALPLRMLGPKSLGAPFLPASVPVTTVCSDFDAEGISKTAQKGENVFAYMSRDMDVRLPGLTVRVVVPPSIRELNLRLRLVKYRTMRDFVISQFIPHSRFVTITPAKPKSDPAASSSTSRSSPEVTDMDTKVVAAEVKKMVLASRRKQAMR